jgi:hypothetical protein
MKGQTPYEGFRAVHPGGPKTARRDPPPKTSLWGAIWGANDPTGGFPPVASGARGRALRVPHGSPAGAPLPHARAQGIPGGIPGGVTRLPAGKKRSLQRGLRSRDNMK